MHKAFDKVNDQRILTDRDCDKVHDTSFGTQNDDKLFKKHLGVKELPTLEG